MKNLLISMSRNKGVIVPVVTLMAIGIGISGYYIQNQQALSREEQAKVAQKDDKPKTQDATISEAEKTEVDDDKAATTQNGQKTETTTVSIEAGDQTEDGTIRLSATVQSDKPGKCAFYLKQGNYGPEDSVVASSGMCEVHFASPGSGQWLAEVQYTSDDGKTQGNAKTNIDI